MTLLIPPEYVNVISSTVYDADLPAPLFQAYCRIVGLAWRDKRHQQLPPATVGELAVYLHCSERSAWGHLIALRKRSLITWTTQQSVLHIHLAAMLVEAPVSLQTFAAPNDHVVVGSIQSDPDLDQQQHSADQSDRLQNFAALQTFAVTANLTALQNFAVDPQTAEAQAVAALPHVKPELIQAWGEHLQQRSQVYNLPGLLLYTLRTTHAKPRVEQRGGSRQKNTARIPPAELPIADPVLLPDEVQAKLAQLGWNGDAAEIAAAQQIDPQRVLAWLDYALAQTAARNRAGLFRTGLRSPAWPPAISKAGSAPAGCYTTDESLFTQPESLSRS